MVVSKNCLLWLGYVSEDDVLPKKSRIKRNYNNKIQRKFWGFYDLVWKEPSCHQVSSLMPLIIICSLRYNAEHYGDLVLEICSKGKFCQRKSDTARD